MTWQQALLVLGFFWSAGLVAGVAACLLAWKGKL